SRVARLLFTTGEQAEGWVANGYPASHVVEVFETSVDRPIFPKSTASPPETPRIVCLGRLDDVKDPLTSLRGFSLFAEDYPGATLDLCWTAAPLYAEVLANAGTARLHGRLDPAATARLLASADALIQSSKREVCGVAVLEAMAWGVPPVVTDIPAFR